MICRKAIFSAVLVCLAACRPQVGPGELCRQAYKEFLLGNLQTADEQAARGAETWRIQREPDWHWRFVLLHARVMLLEGKTEKAKALLPKPLESPELEIRRKATLANALIRLSQYGEAESLLASAERQAAKSNLPSLLPELEVLKGGLFSRTSRKELAQQSFDSAIKHAREQKDDLSQAQALNNLGLMRIQDLKPDDAISYFQQAFTLAESMGARYSSELTLDNLTICYGLLGEFEKAIDLRQKAISFLRKSQANVALQQGIGELGNLYLDKGDPEKAVLYFSQALDLAKRIRNLPDACTWAGNLAKAYIELHRWDEAERYNNIAAELARQANETESLQYTEFNRAAIMAGKGQLAEAEICYRNLVSSSGQNPAVLWEARTGLGTLLASQGRWPEARSQFQSGLQVIERTRTSLLYSDNRITFFARLIRFYRQYVKLLVQQGSVMEALRVADSSRALVLLEGFGSGKPLASGAIGDYRKIAQQHNAVILSYWITPDESYCWAITPQQVRLVRLPPERELAALVSNYQNLIEQQMGDPIRIKSSAARKLYDALVQPVSDLLRSGDQVFLIPDGLLHQLNFETLLTPHETPHYWIEDASIAIVPSLRVLAFRRLVETNRDESLLLIGDPTTHDPSFPKLPYAKDELASIQKRFQAGKCSLYTGNQATPELYRRTAANRFSLIHFSAHAIANNASPLDSAIILSASGGEYKLYARDVMRYPLHANLVTLSACRSAGATSYAGEGLVGFSWAFLHAGARNVVAGLWNVSDRSTAAFMGEFYASLQTGRSPSEALRAAKLKFLHSATSFQKPYYWAPFQIYTAGGDLSVHPAKPNKVVKVGSSAK